MFNWFRKKKKDQENFDPGNTVADIPDTGKQKALLSGTDQPGELVQGTATDEFFISLSPAQKELFRDEECNGYELIIEKGGMQDHVFVLVGTVVLIGRAPKCDVTLDDPMVSDEHAILHIERGKPLEIHDKASKNGTYVNDQPVKETGVKPGDRIRVGHTTLRLEKGSDQ